MTKCPSSRQLPLPETRKQNYWFVSRWALIGSWVLCCLLVVVLLLTQSRFLSAVDVKAVNKAISTSHIKRLLACTSVPDKQEASSRSVNAQPGDEDNSTKAANLDDLWSSLPFTPVVQIPDATVDHEYVAQTGPLQQVDGKPGNIDYSAAYLQHLPLASLQQPTLANPDHPDISLMVKLLDAIASSGTSPDQARAAYKQAFAATPPLPGSTWHIRGPAASNWAHKQQKGAEYEDNSAITSSRRLKDSSNNGRTASHNISKQQQPQPTAHDDSIPEKDGPQRSSTAAAEQLMQYALQLLKSSGRLAACGTEDDSLPLPPPEVAGGPPGGKVLLAAALQDNEEAMPSFVLQITQFAMQAGPGSLFVSIYEAGSSDQTTYWLDVLKLLLFPLRVPAIITTSGSLHAGSFKSTVEYRAAMRNMAIDTFFPSTDAAASMCPGHSSSSSSNDKQAGSNTAAAEEAFAKSSTRAVSEQQMQYRVVSPDQQQQPWQQQQRQPAARKLLMAAHELGAAAATPVAGTAAYAVAAGGALLDAAGAISSADAFDVAAVLPFEWIEALDVDSFVTSSNSSSSLDETLLNSSGYDSTVPTSSMVDAAAGHSIQPQSSLSNGSSSSSGGDDGSDDSVASISDLAACFKPDWVLFIDNGLYFCKSDLSRLLMHKDADLACGWNLGLAEPAAVKSIVSHSNATVDTASIKETVAGTAAVHPANAASGPATAAVVTNAGQETATGSVGLHHAGGVDGVATDAFTPHSAAHTATVASSSSAEVSTAAVLQAPDSLTASTAATEEHAAVAQPQQQQLDAPSALPPTGNKQQQQQPGQNVLVGVLGREDLQRLNAQQLQLQQPTANPSSLVDDVGHQLALTQSRPHQQPATANAGTAALPVTPVALGPTPSAATLAKFPFYYADYGVGKMVNGQLFDVVPPYAGAHQATLTRLAAGLPVQVYCCWSGLAKLRAESFRRGLRFRDHQQGECKTSDTSLLCDDLHRLGFSRALVDSGVLVTGQHELSARLSNAIRQAQRMPYIRRSRWVEVQGGGSPWLYSNEQLRQLTYPTVACCDGDHQDSTSSAGAAAAITSDTAGNTAVLPVSQLGYRTESTNSGNTTIKYSFQWHGVGSDAMHTTGERSTVNSNNVLSQHQAGQLVDLNIFAGSIHMSSEDLISAAAAAVAGIGDASLQRCRQVDILVTNHTAMSMHRL